MNIPLARPDITEAEIEAVIQVLKTPNLSLGPELPEFEKAIADYAGVRYAVAVNSGTSALHLIIRGLGIGEDDEVITTPFSFISSSNCILFERAKPVFVDIEPKALNIDPERIEAVIIPRTKVILAKKSGVRSSFDGFLPLVNALSNNADGGVAQPHECTDFLQCIIVAPLCGCWRSVE